MEQIIFSAYGKSEVSTEMDFFSQKATDINSKLK